MSWNHEPPKPAGEPVASVGVEPEEWLTVAKLKDLAKAMSALFDPDLDREIGLGSSSMRATPFAFGRGGKSMMFDPAVLGIPISDDRPPKPAAEPFVDGDRWNGESKLEIGPKQHAIPDAQSAAARKRAILGLVKERAQKGALTSAERQQEREARRMQRDAERSRDRYADDALF